VLVVKYTVSGKVDEAVILQILVSARLRFASNPSRISALCLGAISAIAAASWRDPGSRGKCRAVFEPYPAAPVATSLFAEEDLCGLLSYAGSIFRFWDRRSQKPDRQTATAPSSAVHSDYDGFAKLKVLSSMGDS